MAQWFYGIGNLSRRAPAPWEAVAPATEDAALPLERLGDDQPDTQGAFVWRSDGAYAAVKDLNLLAMSSEAAHKPTGWADLLLELAGTPGLPANPADYDDADGRTGVLFAYGPVVQHVRVMPGETLRLDIGIEWPSASTGATGVQVTVTDEWSGKSWDGGSDGWTEDGVLLEQTSGDAWSDVQETIDPDPLRTEASYYRVVIEPIAASYGADTLVYASMYMDDGPPALLAEFDLAAVLGHNLPQDATVSVAGITITPAQPSCKGTATAAFARTATLSIQMPTGVYQPRPVIGDIWIGLARTFDRSPTPDSIGFTEGDPDQIRLEGARKRQEVLGDEGYPVASKELEFKVPEADYVRVRDEITRATMFGVEPILLIPSSSYEGARFYHGRVGPEVRYSRLTVSESDEQWRSFRLEFVESPFAAP